VLAQSVSEGTRPDILPSGGFGLMILVGTVGGVLLVLAGASLFVESRARAKTSSSPGELVTGFLALVVLGYSLTYALATVTGLPMNDRYVLPVAPLAALLVLRERALARSDATPSTSSLDRPTLLAGWLVLAALVCLGIVYTADSASFDGTRWKVALAATHAGWRADQIAGGFEWTNFYASEAKAGTRARGHRCVAVIVDPPALRRRRVVAIRSYRSPLVGSTPVVAVRLARPCTKGSADRSPTTG
jgi:hypothetical protein